MTPRRTPCATKDRNHDAVVGWFNELGCSVIELHHAGIPGYPDLNVGCIGVTHLVEIKNGETRYGRAGLNANQTAFARDWRGSPMHTVTTHDDVIALVQQWRKRP